MSIFVKIKTNRFSVYSNYKKDENYDDYEEEIPPLDLDEIYDMKLPDKLKERLEGRLLINRCQKLATLGSGESCQTSNECRCGEFCSAQGSCEQAECSLHNQAICQTYPGFNAK